MHGGGGWQRAVRGYSAKSFQEDFPPLPPAKPTSTTPKASNATITGAVSKPKQQSDVSGGSCGGKGRQSPSIMPIPLSVWKDSVSNEEAKVRDFVSAVGRLSNPASSYSNASRSRSLTSTTTSPSSSSSPSYSSTCSNSEESEGKAAAQRMMHLTNHTVDLAAMFPDIAPDLIFSVLVVTYPDINAAIEALAPSSTSSSSSRSSSSTSSASASASSKQREQSGKGSGCDACGSVTIAYSDAASDASSNYDDDNKADDDDGNDDGDNNSDWQSFPYDNTDVRSVASSGDGGAAGGSSASQSSTGAVASSSSSSVTAVSHINDDGCDDASNFVRRGQVTAASFAAGVTNVTRDDSDVYKRLSVTSASAAASKTTSKATANPATNVHANGLKQGVHTGATNVSGSKSTVTMNVVDAYSSLAYDMDAAIKASLALVGGTTQATSASAATATAIATTPTPTSSSSSSMASPSATSRGVGSGVSHHHQRGRGGGVLQGRRHPLSSSRPSSPSLSSSSVASPSSASTSLYTNVNTGNTGPPNRAPSPWAAGATLRTQAKFQMPSPRELLASPPPTTGTLPPAPVNNVWKQGKGGGAGGGGGGSAELIEQLQIGAIGKNFPSVDLLAIKTAFEGAGCRNVEETTRILKEFYPGAYVGPADNVDVDVAAGPVGGSSNVGGGGEKVTRVKVMMTANGTRVTVQEGKNNINSHDPSSASFSSMEGGVGGAERLEEDPIVDQLKYYTVSTVPDDVLETVLKDLLSGIIIPGRNLGPVDTPFKRLRREISYVVLYLDVYR